MKNILFVTIHLPYPPSSGASMYNTFRIIQHLTKEHNVFFASLLKDDDRQYADEFLEATGIKEAYFEDLNVPRSISGLIKSYIKGLPLNLYRNYSETFVSKINELAGRSEIIWIDHYEAFQYVPPLYQGKVILRLHNAWYKMWERYAQLSRNPIKKMATYAESKRVRSFEKEYCNRADKVLSASADSIYLEPDKEAREAKFSECLFLGDDSQLHLPVPAFEDLENAIIYVGTLTWEANIDGLEWFINGCWEKLKSANPDLKFYIIGKNPSPRLKKLAGRFEDIVLTGFIDDLEEYFTKCKVNVVPLRFGSGIKVKVINGLYRGIPIVTTSVGIESIDVKADHHLIVADSHEEMISSINRLLQEKESWERISKNAKQVAEEKFTWARLYENLDQVMEHI